MTETSTMSGNSNDAGMTRERADLLESIVNTGISCGTQSAT